MNFDELNFGVFKEITPNIVEVIVHEGVELTKEMMILVEQVLTGTYVDEGYCLLINRMNPYSHTMGSIEKVAKLKNLKALAIVTYSDLSEETAKIHTHFQDNAQIFSDKKEALLWLTKKLKS